jgi:hypothetical protein
MIKISLKTACLVFLSLFSITSFANTPWAEEASSPITQNDAEPAAQEAVQAEASSPAAMQDQEDVKTTQVKTSGDVLTTPVSSVVLLDFPRRGMSTDKVKNELGQPVEIIPAVGTPPISRWIYNDRVVFFEGSSVIHVVAN